MARGSTAGKTARKTVRGRAPGRPRDPAVDQKVLRAALALFIEHGFAGASIDKIARRAKVARTSIYRRWSSREALLAEAIELGRDAAEYSAELVDRTPPERVAALLLGGAELAARPETRKLVARLIGSIPDSPRLLAVYRETYYLPRRRAFLRALERVRKARLLPIGTDIEALADMLTGFIVHRALLAPPGEATPAALRLHLRQVLRQAGFKL
jgi:AcrR family transcriptional regulator